VRPKRATPQEINSNQRRAPLSPGFVAGIISPDGVPRALEGENDHEPQQLQRLLLTAPTLSEDDLQGFAQVHDGWRQSCDGWMSVTPIPTDGW
jgi:hypothetical protein